jgi:uncharacterized membrane protein YbhN (UPF0104 family)
VQSSFWRPSLRAVLVWVGLVVSGVFAYVAVRDARPSQTWDALRDTSYVWLVPSLALLIVAFFLRAVRWWWLFAPERRPPLGEVTKALFVGYLANTLLPARAGEAARTVALNRTARTPIAEVAATVVIERTYDVLSLVLLLFVTVPWLPHVTWLRGAALVGGALVALLLVLAAVVLRWRDRPLHVLFRPLRLLPFVPDGYLDRAPRQFVSGLAGLLRPRVAIGAFAWTTLSWVVLGVGYWCAMLAFDLGLSPLAGLLVVIGIGLAMILPSSPAALGVFEAATVVVLGAYGVDDSLALSYALVLHVLNVLPFVLLPLPLLVLRWLRRNRPLVAEL